MGRWTDHIHNNQALFNTPENILKFFQEKLDVVSIVFQLEKGEVTDCLHYQMYFKLKTKIRPKQLATFLNSAFFGIEIRCAHSEEYCIKYCQKTNTRVGGPWSFP